MAQLSIAWLLVNHDISTIIVGSTKITQVEDILPAFQVYKKLDSKILKEIEEIMGNSPNPQSPSSNIYLILKMKKSFINILIF